MRGGVETDLGREREPLAAIPLLFLPMVRYFFVCGAVVVSAIASKFPLQLIYSLSPKSARVFAWNVMVGIALLPTRLSLVFWREKL